MALNFPINPSVGQTYQTGSSATYRFNGRFWDVTQGSPLEVISASFASTSNSSSYAVRGESVVVISGSSPTSVRTSSLWYNNTESELYIRSGSAWAPATANDKTKTYVTGSQPSSAKIGDLWFDTSRSKMLVEINGSGSFADVISGSAPFKNITKMSSTGYGGIIFVADGRVYVTKGNDGGYATQVGALSPNSTTTGLRRGVANAYEIPFPGEIAGTVIDAGNYGFSAYALFANGDLYTWGRNNHGQLGTGGTTDAFYPVQAATGIAQVYPTQGENDPEQLRLIVRRSSDGAILGCGYNLNGELGLGDANVRNSLTALTWAGNNPLSVWNLGSWSGNIFVQLANGQIWVSGRNTQGQIGNGGTVSSNSAQQVSAWLAGNNSNRIVQMFAGHREITGGDGQNFTNMMLLRDPNTNQTTILGAGYNGHGQLGRGNTLNSNVPVSPTGAWASVQEMAYVGGAVGTVYVLNTNGSVYAWGRNGEGQVGTGNTTSPQSSPVEITSIVGATDIVQLSQGFYTFPFNTIAPPFRRSDGYYTTGFNTNGQTGTGSTAAPLTTWTRMRFPDDVIIKFIGCLITQSSVQTYIAVDNQNRTWAWGWNGQNQIDAEIGNHFWQPIQIVADTLRN